ncbi:hypothetical protein ACYJ1Y_06540 [Natrialbaceae archaeon A-gly3]
MSVSETRRSNRFVSGSPGSGSITTEVIVPADLQVSRVETTSGDLEVTAVEGETAADTTNGDVDVWIAET